VETEIASKEYGTKIISLFFFFGDFELSTSRV
jgi:hypothetical protein